MPTDKAPQWKSVEKHLSQKTKNDSTAEEPSSRVPHRRLPFTQKTDRPVHRLYSALNQRTGGWLEILRQTYINFNQHECSLRAAAFAYRAFFSIFPLMLLFIVVGSSFLAQQKIRSQARSIILQYMPSPELAAVVTDVIQEQVDSLVEQRGIVGVLASIGLLWGASGMFSTISDALNVAWGVQRRRPFWRGKVVSISVALLIGALSLLSIGATTVVSLSRFLLSQGFIPFHQYLDQAASTLLPVTTNFMMFLMLYKILPYTSVSWRSAGLGALIAAVIWEGAKMLFAFYFLGIAQGRYSSIYGSLGSVIVFLLWAYLSGIILLIGAELAATYNAHRSANRLI